MIDFEFITQLEGFELDGYVPKPDGGKIESGVTIASGFDLGQRTAESLPEWMREMFDPYCGITGHDAERIIDQLPLQINFRDALLVNEYAHHDAVGRLMSYWPTDCIPFSCLSDECQTVIASVSFQYGDLRVGTPKFWRQVTTGDWEGALKNLRDFGDDYKTRRNTEADLLESRLFGGVR